MMKKLSRRIGAALVLAATPGFCGMSCSGTVAREFRDSAIEGAGDYVELTAFELLEQWFPILRDEE